jgi:hypothetical protein
MIDILSFNIIKDALTALLFAYFVAYQCENQIRDKERFRYQLNLPTDPASIDPGMGGTGSVERLGPIN